MISMVSCSSSISNRPLWVYPLVPFVISPENPLYHGSISLKSSPLSFDLMQSTSSLGLKQGMFVDQPVPMPSAPLTKTSGIIGKYLEKYKNSYELILNKVPFRLNHLPVIFEVF